MTSYQEGVLSLSYGKDSLACLGAIEKLGLPLTRIIHAEIWATETISADLPPMVEFKEKADEIIKSRWGIEVEHICALKTRGREEANLHTNISFTEKMQKADSWETSKDFPAKLENGVKSSNTKTQRLTYEDVFYRVSRKSGKMYGFPLKGTTWCVGMLKTATLDRAFRERSGFGAVQYFGVAADEPERIARHGNRDGVVLPLVLAGWDEAYCRKWCEENDLLSPIYTTATRGGCWFCHNQGVGQLRLLRKNYPDLWALLLKWDVDSPVTFHSDGRTVHDFDRRFQLEDEGLIFPDERFRWSMLDSPIQMRLDI